MHDVRHAVAAFLLLNVVVGLVRVVRGPTLADRMLVTQLFGTSAAAVLLLLSADPGATSLRDVALVFALFASVTVVAFVRIARPKAEPAGDER